jgi:DNA repair protein RecO
VGTLRDDAVCIRHWDWSETSQTVALLGRETGLIRGLAKGAKRENARFSGGLEILTRGELLAVSKPGAGLATLTSWDLRETYPALRRSLRAFYCGMYFADLVQHLVSEGDPHPALFDLLIQSLRQLDEPAGPEKALLKFQWGVLSEAGYRPELDQDVLSGQALDEAPTYGFRPQQGGLSRDPAAETKGAAQAAGAVWRVRGDTVRLLRGLSGSPLEAAASARPESLDRANRLLAMYVREILGRQPAAMSCVFAHVSNASAR